LVIEKSFVGYLDAKENGVIGVRQRNMIAMSVVTVKEGIVMGDFSTLVCRGDAERRVVFFQPYAGMAESTMTPEYAISLAKDLIEAANIAKAGDLDV